MIVDGDVDATEEELQCKRETAEQDGGTEGRGIERKRGEEVVDM